MVQAKFVDLDVWFRTGGVNWELTKLNQDAVAIQAGIGTWANPLLAEQVAGAVAHEIPYFTWWIPDIRDGPMPAQVDYYLSLPGVANALTCLDLEPPGGGTRCVNGPEARTAILRVEDKTGEAPLLYSNQKYITEDLQRPAWMPEYWWWLAQYYYWLWPISFFNNYDTFLAKYSGALPKSAMALGLEDKTIAWQFSHKGDAWSLCANERTLDPNWPVGIKECDLAVSTIEKDVFLSMLGPVLPPPPPPPSQGLEYIVMVDTLNVRGGPGVGYAIVDQLHLNNTGEIVGVGGTDSWFQIGSDRWIAGFTGGYRYSRVI